MWSNQLMFSLMITQLAKKGIFVFQILKWKKTMSSDSKIAIFPSRGAQTLMKVGSSSKGVKLSILIFTQWSHNFDIMHIFISRVDWKGPRKDILFWRRKQMLCKWNLGDLIKSILFYSISRYCQVDLEEDYWHKDLDGWCYEGRKLLTPWSDMLFLWEHIS